MHSFSPGSRLFEGIPPTIARALGEIERAAGREDRYREQKPAVLRSLAARARVESIRASSAIEDVIVPSPRLERVVHGSPPRTRSEEELAGYTSALDHLLGPGGDEPFGLPLVLRLHRLLFSFTDSLGGRLKSEENRVVDKLPDGTQVDRFRTVPVRETEFHLRELHARFEELHQSGRYPPIVLIGAFAFDLLCIHPFADGNGRTARLVTTTLLLRDHYEVVRYVALDDLIDKTSDGYYRSLAASTTGWHESEHDPWPWLGYLVDRIAEAYTEFDRLVTADESFSSKRAQARAFILEYPQLAFTRDDIRVGVPGVSEAMLTKVLRELRSEGLIEQVGRGPRSSWRRAGPPG